MEIEIKVSITPQQYIRLDNMARRMRRPMDKALGWMVTHHMDSILEKHAHLSAGRAETNRLGCDRMTGLACICFGFVLGTAFTAVCLLADKESARLILHIGQAAQPQRVAHKLPLILTESEEKKQMKCLLYPGSGQQPEEAVISDDLQSIQRFLGGSVEASLSRIGRQSSAMRERAFSRGGRNRTAFIKANDLRPVSSWVLHAPDTRA